MAAAPTATTSTTTSASDSPPSSTATAVQPHNQQQQQQQQPPTQPTQPTPPTPSSASGNALACQWRGCNESRATANELYLHLTEDHIGRKVKNNLSLNCAWGTCSTSTVKRDHITSHVRVHVPFKPHSCSICSKHFKRPQDLKKHVKTHADDSVLSRVPDPHGGPRMRGPGSYHGRGGSMNDLQSLASTAMATGFYDHPMQPSPSGHHGYGQQSHNTHPGYYGGGHHSYGSDLFSSGQGGGGPSQAPSFAARKRGHDALNDFFGAVKRREINPASYGDVADSLMALHGVDLPVLGSTPGFHSTSSMLHPGSHDGSIGPRHHPMPAFPNLRTKSDVLNMDHFLDQIQSTTYDSGNRAAVTGASHPGIHSVARTGLQSGHSEASAEMSLANLTAPAVPKSSHSTQSGTPALTPPSSTSQRSGYSPASVGSDSVSLHGHSPLPSSSAASMYPSLPMTNSRGGTPSGFSGPGAAPTATIGSVFHSDQRQRYSGQMLHRAARPDHEGHSSVEETASREDTDMAIDPALTGLSAPPKRPGTTVFRHTSPTARSLNITDSSANVRVIGYLRELVNIAREKLDLEGDDTEEDMQGVEEEDSSSDYDHLPTGPDSLPNAQMMEENHSLYPILRAVEGAH